MRPSDPPNHDSVNVDSFLSPRRLSREIHVAMALLALFAGVGILNGARMILAHRYVEQEAYTLVVSTLRTHLNQMGLCFIGLVISMGCLRLLLGRNHSNSNGRTSAERLLLATSLGLVLFLSAVFEVPKDWQDSYGFLTWVFFGLGLGFIPGLALIWITRRAAKRSTSSDSTSFLVPPVLARILGVLGLAAIIGVNLGLEGPKPSHVQSPNVILITIDTLRADHLSAYGHSQPSAPHLETLAREGLLFEKAISQAPWTLPSMVSLHTGQYPSELGAHQFRATIPQEVTLLAERFRQERYRTMAVISHSFVDRSHGFEQGFDIFDRRHIRGHEGTSSKELTDAALHYLSQHGEDRFFLWVHYFDPHYSYLSHPEYGFSAGYRGALPSHLTLENLMEDADSLKDEDLSYVKNVYDEEIAYTDEHIGRLLAQLDVDGIADRTIVAITSDHGEFFGEDGLFGHGKEVAQELIHVPLIMKIPGASELGGKRYGNPVEVRWLGHTLLRSAGLDAAPFSGIDLLALVRGDQEPALALSEGSYAWGDDQRKIAVYQQDFKLVLHLDDATKQLYNIKTDPGETKDILADHETLTQELLSLPKLKELTEGLFRDGMVEGDLDQEELERLRALGYIR